MNNKICPPDSAQHVVKKGDTLWKLSQTHGVSVQSISDANPGVDPQNLQIGSTLCIPAVPTPHARPMRPVTCPEGTFPHTIQEGDTFWRLSQTYGVSIQSISDANPGVNPQNLQIGSTLCIPAVPTPYALPMRPVTCPEGTFPHTIQEGDTFWRLSQTYGVSIQSISDANPGVNPQNLQIGSTLCIPAVPIPLVPPMRPITCPVGTFPHTIQEGDTFWRLSQTYGVSIQSISDANPGVDPQNLQIGSTLCIPAVPMPLVPPIPPITLIPPAVPIPSAQPIPLVPPIPPDEPLTPAPPVLPVFPSEFAYLIRKCDSICGIARKFYVSVESILQINPWINPRCLQAGTIIYVPINCCGRNAFRYAARAGDTLNRIANKFNVCPLDLIAANPNIDFQHLVRCQIICIPSA